MFAKQHKVLTYQELYRLPDGIVAGGDEKPVQLSRQLIEAWTEWDAAPEDSRACDDARTRISFIEQSIANTPANGPAGVAVKLKCAMAEFWHPDDETLAKLLYEAEIEDLERQARGTAV